jgi:hypothetical protein
MPAEIVNLRRVRKAKARGEKERQAAQNRAAFGRTKAERLQSQAEEARLRAQVEGHRLSQKGTGEDDKSRP